jgi:Multiubiquitin
MVWPMNTYSSNIEGHNIVVENHTQNGKPASKWLAIVNDELIPMPERRVRISVLREQAKVPNDYALLRDYDSPDDFVMPDNGITDLGEGNVFYTEPACDVKPHPACLEPAKLGYSVDDCWEIVIKPEQTGRTIRDLFNLPEDVELLRDFHSPHDEPIEADESANFEDGPVFVTKKAGVMVKVNNNPVEFTKRHVTGSEIKQTAIAQKVAIKEDFVLYKVKSGGELGPVIKDGEKVKLHECEEFRAVTPDDNS